MRKKILLISPYFPYPPYDGGKVRIYNLIKFLSRNNEIILLSYAEPSGAQPPGLSELQKYCKEIHVVPRDENRRIITGHIPRSPTFFYTPEMLEKLESVLRVSRPDIVQIEFLIMTQYAELIKGIPVVYTEHDMSSIDFEQSFHDRDLDEKTRFPEWAKLVEYHKRVLRSFDGVIVLTQRDRRMLDEFSPGLRTAIAPTGVDTEFYRPFGSGPAEGKEVAFLGHYRHFPNADAVDYFMRDIWPGILKNVPEARFSIIGSGATRQIMKYASANVFVTGDVPDVRVPLSNASVFAAPVRLGGGIKGKVLEAMACGVPVVASEEAAAGFINHPGEDILVAKGPAEFAEMVTELLLDDGKRADMARKARILIEQNYGWEKITGQIEAFYDDILSARTLNT